MPRLSEQLRLPAITCALVALFSSTAIAQTVNDYQSASLPAGLEFTGTVTGGVRDGDFDGDGDADFISTASGGGAITFYRNNGDGTFSINPTPNPFVNFTSSGVNTFIASSALTSVFDYDNDGDLDIWHRQLNGIDTLLENVNGVYQSVALPAGLEFTYAFGSGAVLMADFDGDGDVDFSGIETSSGPAWFLRNNGNGTFTTNPSVGNPFANFVSSIPSGYTPNISATAADFDGDGDIDVWQRIGGDGNDLYLRNDSGTLVVGTLPTGLEYIPTTTALLYAGDFDGDGDLDTASQDAIGGAISYRQNNGNGTFTLNPANNPFSAFSSSTPANTAFNLSGSFADIDDDGDLDIWIRRGGSEADIYLQNTVNPVRVLSTTPSSGATGVDNDTTITLSLSRSINPWSGNVYIRRYDDDTIVETINANDLGLTFGANSLTINRSVTLADNTRYYVSFDRTFATDSENYILGKLDNISKVRVPFTDKEFLNFTTGTSNTAPTITNPIADNFSVGEDSGNSTFTLANRFTDAETDASSLVYSVEANNNTTLVGASIDNNTDVLTLSYAANASGSATITIRATDAGGLFVEDTFTVTVLAVNDAPTDLALSNATVNQSGGANAVVGTLSTTDSDDVNHTYTLVSGTGSTDNASFNISGTSLRANDASAISNGSYSVRVRTTDAGGLNYEEAFSITVVDDIPTNFENGTPTISELTQTSFRVTGDFDAFANFYIGVTLDGAGSVTANDIFQEAAFSGGPERLLFADIPSTSSEPFITSRVVTGLERGTAYDVYLYVNDGQSNTSNVTKLDVTTLSVDSDGNLTAGPSYSFSLASTVDTVGEAVDVFGFTLSDGGTADGLAMQVSQVVVNVSGTSTDAQRGQMTWRLNGPDAANVVGVYNAGSDTVTFSGLSISVADGANEDYTINAYFNDNSGITDNATAVLSIDGDTDVTTSSSGTRMGTT
uniref:beta strand repeat-containing protein n=1 Tax=Pseudidiomarina aestuarii TaxID=624146 RepID=UPI003A96AD04